MTAPNASPVRQLSPGADFAFNEDVKGEIDWKTLCFKDVQKENGFLEATLPEKSFWLFLFFELFSAASLGHVGMSWSTAGDRFAPETIQEMKLPKAFNTLVVVGLAISLVTMVASRIQRRCGCMSTRNFERVIVVMLMALSAVICCLHPWYIARMTLGGGISLQNVVIEDKAACDAFTVLLLDGVLTTAHMILPMRWSTLVSFQVFTFVFFSLCSMACTPTDSSSFYKILFLAILTGATSSGKRCTEIHERMDFLRLIVERERRVIAERQLDMAPSNSESCPACATPRSRGTPPSFPLPQFDDEASCQSIGAQSDAKSNSTSIMFSLQKTSDAKNADRFGSLCTVGFNESWLIRWDHVRLLPKNIIGVGGFGFVMKASYHGAEVVMKAPLVPRGGGRNDGGRVAVLLHELRMLRKLRHPNIVGFYGCCVAPELQDLLLVLEYVRGLALGTYLNVPKCEPRPDMPLPSTNARRKLAADVCCALRYLHAQDPCVVHGDIKDKNTMVECLVDGGVNAKLVDFGLSRRINPRSRPLSGTQLWMPPEVLHPIGTPPAPSADVYSFGLLLYLVATSKRPWDDTNRATRSREDEGSENSEVVLNWVGQPMAEEVDLICFSCTQHDPARRPSMLQVYALLTTSMKCATLFTEQSQDDNSSKEPGGGGFYFTSADEPPTWSISQDSVIKTKRHPARQLQQARCAAKALLAEEAQKHLQWLMGEERERPPSTSSQKASGICSPREEVSFNASINMSFEGEAARSLSMSLPTSQVETSLSMPTAGPRPKAGSKRPPWVKEFISCVKDHAGPADGKVTVAL